MTDKQYSALMESMTPELDAKLGEMIQDVLTEYADGYELITDKPEFERVEFRPVPGFVPFTDGGFNTLLIFRNTEDTKHCPKTFQPKINEWLDQCQSAFFDEHCTDEAKDATTVQEYMDKLLDPETGIEQDKEAYYEYERSYIEDLYPALEIRVLYYNRDNAWNDSEDGIDCVQLSVAANYDAPYYRDGRGIQVQEPLKFPVDANLPEAVSTALRKILAEV